MGSPVAGLRCRQIAATDLDAVATLLARGFRSRNRAFWLRAFAELTRHQPPPGLPKYGYLLESHGVLVGAILMICTAMRSGGTTTTRCNLSSWFVEPPFRAYAPMLVAQALRHKDVTYLNVSSAPHTRPIIEAQGFARYADGVFLALPMLQGPFASGTLKLVPAGSPPPIGCDPYDNDVMLQHVAHGCIGLWCVTPERAYPFVFRPRMVRRFLPCAQLIYCRDVADLVRFAGPIGRFIARHGKPLVVIDANAPIPGLLGIYNRGKMPKYFKGPQRPRLGDLAYTEHAVLGV